MVSLIVYGERVVDQYHLSHLISDSWIMGCNWEWSGDDHSFPEFEFAEPDYPLAIDINAIHSTVLV